MTQSDHRHRDVRADPVHDQRQQQKNQAATQIAELAGFLASKEAAYLTGQWLAVDGGLDALSEDCF